MSEAALRAEIVACARELDASGLNRGSSGNVSARCGDALLITPSAIPASRLEPEMLARMPLEGRYGSWEGPLKPSSEWRFHVDLMRARSDFDAIVHTHSPFATILSIAHKPIPAVHYMMAAFGGPEIRCSDYACYGTADLSAAVLRAIDGMAGCLMGNHGMIVGGPNLTRAAWLAHELEALAHQYFHVLQIGGGRILSAEELAETAKGFGTYGVQDTKD
ncbi:MAG: class II aldolase/adducin family protein [Sphingomonadales bacterium]|nr:class II aldolase/adducin family protein [Sphingomonadales bacterium]